MDEAWHEQPRIWTAAPPAAPLRGVWVLRAAMYVRKTQGRMSITLDGSSDPEAGRTRPLWRSRDIIVGRPATYTDAIPQLTSTLWELNTALHGSGIRFEQS